MKQNQSRPKHTQKHTILKGVSITAELWDSTD